MRTLLSRVEEIHQECGESVPRRLRRIVVAGVVTNPWAGRRVEDLGPGVQAIHRALAPALIARLLAHAEGKERIEAFGKGVIVGLGGEVEHGAALIHTPHLGDPFRAAVEGTSIIAFSELRAEAGATLSIPMWHIRRAATRSHYQAAELHIPDAPRADEIVVALAASTGPRPFPRIGDRLTD
ncbi:MAG TPA: amino acid synthesis family protein [Solirubrobacteraceae bacterium]|nr:amino acid synthesis family protein [Solirubrobacteraceae bacterium]